MQKLRVRSPLDKLPLHVIAAIKGFLTTGGPHSQGLTYAEARKRIKAEFGVETSAPALCAFFHRHVRAIVSRLPDQTVQLGNQAFTLRVSIEIEPKK